VPVSLIRRCISPLLAHDERVVGLKVDPRNDSTLKRAIRVVERWVYNSWSGEQECKGQDSVDGRVSGSLTVLVRGEPNKN
jgi:hypothetical protein